jgi:subtilisin family serine protease
MRRSLLLFPVAWTLALVGCSDPSPPATVPATTTNPADAVSLKLDRPLTRLVHATNADLPALAGRYVIDLSTGSPVFKVLFRVSDPSASLPEGADVIVLARFGSILSANVTRDGLRRLADVDAVTRIEAVSVMRPNNEVGTSVSSVETLTIDAKGNVIPFTAKAGQTVTWRMVKPGKATLTSTLSLYANAAGTGAPIATGTNNEAGGDARLTHTFASGGTFYLHAKADTGPVVADAGAPATQFALYTIGDASTGVAIGTKARGTGYDGTGVIVGSVDTGVDFCHPDFIDPKTGKTRILYFWDQSLTATGAEKAPAEFAAIGGVEYTEAQINAALPSCANNGKPTLVRSQDVDAHGTHTTGTAAGNGQATNDAAHEPAGKYAGAAPGAQLIVVKGLGSGIKTQHLGEGLLYVKKRADALKKPFVINNSWGGYGDADDGTTLLEQVVSSVAGAGGVPVFSAGNNGYFAAHATQLATTPAIGVADPVVVSTFPCAGIGLDAAAPPPAGACASRDLSLWLDGKDDYDLTLTAPDKTTGTFTVASHDPTNGQTITVGGLAVKLYADTTPEGNGAKNYYLTIPASPTDIAAAEEWTVAFTRVAGSTGSGKWDAYLPSDTYPWRFKAGEVHVKRMLQAGGKASWSPGTVGSPATAFGVISVGALSADNVRWVDATAGGTTEPNDSEVVFPELGNLAYYSSRGPSRDGRLVPIVASPGTNVMSSKSRFASAAEVTPDVSSRDGQHVAFSGTSMAAPNVTGVVAQILQMDPHNFSRPLIRNTAVHDALTNDGNKNGWNGVGKVDAVAAIAALTADKPPTASSLTAAPAAPVSGASVVLTAVAHDPDGDATIEEYLWDVDGDGLTDLFTTAPTATTTAPKAGSHTAMVTVVDKAGRTATTSLTYIVKDAPDAGAPDAGPDGSTDAGADTGAADGGSLPSIDAGSKDAGPTDAGARVDSGADAGKPVTDAGGKDSGGSVDSGTPGTGGGGDNSGCSVGGVGGTSGASSFAVAAALAGAVALLRRRRKQMAV